jgi:hypothetical protein
VGDKYLKNMNTNKFEFENSFDKWLDLPPADKAKHNPFVKFLSESIKSWPIVKQPEIEELIDEKIRLEISRGDL